MTQVKKQRSPMNKKLRVLVAKVGLDGHDRGVKIVARALRDAGIEVIYLGVHNTPVEIVMSAVQEDVDAIGLSVHSAAHMTLFGEVMRLLKENKANDMVVFGGGIVPEEDIGKLKRMGVREIFTPGASLEAIVSFVTSIGIKTPKARRSKQESIPSFAVPARAGGKSRNQAKRRRSA
jgi:methylmalonyl-CoA mutase C-terminal domain/subunit